MIGKLRLLYYKSKYKNKIVVGKNFHSRLGLIFEVVDDGLVVIGDNCFMNNYCSINCLKTIRIGNDVIFGENVKIYDHNHIFNKKGLIKEQGFSKKEVIIGNNVWVASNVTILAGTHIGDNYVIGCGCVLKGNIPSGSIVKKQLDYKIENIIY